MIRKSCAEIINECT